MRWRGFVLVLATALLPATWGANAVIGAGVAAAEAGPATCQPCDLGVKLNTDGKLQLLQNPPLPHQQANTPSANIVWARYWDSYEDTGWDRLEISVLPAVPLPDLIKARAAGFIEGQIHAHKIYDYWTNYRLNEFQTPDNQPTQDLLDWVSAQDSFIRTKISLHAARSRTAAGHTSRPWGDADPGGEAIEDPEDGDSEEDSEGRYWRLMGLIMAQFDGLCDGFWESTVTGRNMSYYELYLLQSLGDLYDLKVLFPQHLQTQQHQGSGPSTPTVPKHDYQPGHGDVGAGGIGSGELLECSALIKLQQPQAEDYDEDDDGDGGGSAAWLQATALPRAALALPERQQGPRPRPRPHRERSSSNGFGGSSHDKPDARPEYWAGHATWRPFYAMIRTWKIYELPWSKTGPITVSSSPGLVGYSKDDWYTTDSFVIMETTNGIYNRSLYDAIHHDCALMWQRVQVANLGASDGSEWVSLFQKYNSGTYNNQWMVLDAQRLSKGQKTGLLWVLEQIPGATEAADVSHVLLKQGYWASYNVPYFQSVYNVSGYPIDEDLHSSCPRALLFAREQERVHSTQDMQALMRLNRYQTDPLSKGNPAEAVASRYDLKPLPGMVANWTKRAFGAVDAKVINRWSFTQRLTYMINGPTNDDQPSFSWPDFCELDRDQAMKTTAATATEGRRGGGQRRNSRKQGATAAAAALAADTSSSGLWQRQQHAVGTGASGSCGISHIGLVDAFDFVWEGIQASLPWLRTDQAGEGEAEANKEEENSIQHTRVV